MVKNTTRHLILGTAGHIDHGKSRLVEALTGINPDRLKEEKERGITIDLGFANLTYPDGLVIGIVDVPGHEKLIKNMLAGVGGIDMVLLVVDAEEGIMPQTKEHVYICDLLGIREGIVAITKIDLVDDEWLALIMEDVREFLSSTSLKDAEIIGVSAVTGENISLLKEKIKECADKIEPKPHDGPFRLPIDRVFTMRGFGTIVTGTAISGTLSIDEQVEILPDGLKSKVRGLHAYGRDIKKAYAGQRVAINLQGIKKEEIKRGDVVVKPSIFKPTYRVDGVVNLINGAPLVKSGTLVHFHTATLETTARIVFYGEKELKAGGRALCQLRFKYPVVVTSLDRFIIRRFSPLETIGGGEVLDPWPEKIRANDKLLYLKLLEAGTIKE
ncbi:MAG: selenocysteine-specific translation elongation factor, partial [Nitrospirae bacterium]